MNARPGEAALAALATVTAIWPVTTLLDSGEWVRGAVAMVLVVALVGVAARSVRLRGWQVALAQTVAAAVVAGWLYGRGHLWHGLPGIETATAFNSLLVDARGTIESFTAPAPTTRGLSLLVGLVAGVVAVVVDYLAVTRRSAAMAGLPLLAVFLGSSANSGSSLHPAFFVALAVVWLVMVGRQGTGLVRRWSTTSATPLTPVSSASSVGDTGAAGTATLGRSLGVVAIAAALVVPLALPHLPTRFLLSGLGRNDDSSGSGGSVGFSQSLDLARDLADRSTRPVLTYRTTASAPPPLRVTVSSTYVNGSWLPPRRSVDRTATSADPSVPTPTGLDPSVPKRRESVSVLGNLLEPPNLAAPYPLAGADLGGTRWGLDNRTQSVLVADQVSGYDLSYWDVEPTDSMLRDGVPGATTNRVVDPRDLQVDSRSAARVRALADAVTKGRTNAYDRALAIQEFLRSNGGFTYSLTLAPPVTDQSGRVLPLDPLSHFLVTRQGYCVQFSTAMIMMARAQGIPARIAVGFLPGHVDRGIWTVAVADAHAWPELYLDGIGWLRFEPTPAARSGAAPIYATVLPGSSADEGRPTDTTASGSSSSTRKQDLLERANDVATPQTALPGGSARASWVDHLPHGWSLVLLAVLLGLVGAAAAPAGALWSRRRRLRSAPDGAGRVEAQWVALTEQLADLGMPAPPSQTPRQLHDHYVREAYLDHDGEQALGRVLGTLERARYAPPRAAVVDVRQDAHRVLRAVAPTRPLWLRLRAVVMPSAGTAEVRRLRRRTARALGSPFRAVAALVRRLTQR
ncbi:transglutaminase family protein [Oryzihumus sp.]